MTVTSTRPEDLDVLDPSLRRRGLDHLLYDWLRSTDPVHLDERNDLWVVTRYADVGYVERHPETFSSASGIRPAGEGSNISIISMDDPEHARQRRIISQGFTPRRINQLMDRIREVARQLVEEIAPLGECDLVPTVAYQLPLIVIAEMLGMPVEDRAQLGRWSDAMMAGDGAEGDDPRITAAGQAWGEYVTYLVGLLEDRRRHPRDDLISVLLHAHAEGRLESDPSLVDARVQAGEVSGGRDAELANDEVLAFLTLLLVAGNETTRNAMSGGVLALSRAPEQRRRLVADLSLVPTAVEEVLRYVSPVLTFTRTVTTDTELGGRQLRAGERLLLVYPAANRDPEQFDDPHDLRVDRSPNLHLAFGAGPHFCLGANLARTELRIMYEELYSRLPDLRVPEGVEPERGDSTLVAPIESMPVVYTPA